MATTTATIEVDIAVGRALSITTPGQARVDIVAGTFGAGDFSYPVNAARGELVLGPYGSPVRIRIRPAAGSTVTYNDKLQQVGVFAEVDPVTGVADGILTTSAARQFSSVPLIVTGGDQVGDQQTATFVNGSGAVQWFRQDPGTLVITDIAGQTGTTYTRAIADVNLIVAAYATSWKPTAAGRITRPGVPTAPQNVVATAGDQQATITWTAPASTNGGALLNPAYIVTRLPGGQQFTTNALTYTDTGLTNGTEYTYYVQAVNSSGPSPAAASQAVTPAAAPVITPYIGAITQRNRLPNAFASTGTIKQMGTWQFRDVVSAVPAGQKIYIDYTNVLGINESLSAPGEVASYVEWPVGVYTKFKTAANADLAVLGATLSTVTLEGVLADNLPEGARIWIYTWVNWTGANAVYQSDNANRLGTWTTSTREGAVSTNTTTPDQGLTGTRGANSDGLGFNPVAVRSLTNKPTIAIIGDSQERGSASTIDTNPEDGLVGQAERRWIGYGTINVSVSGDSYAFAVVNGNFQERAVITQSCTHVHDGYGANDSGSMTWEILIGTYVPAIKAKYPGKVYMHTTFDPKATSTDYYVTLENQTPAASWTEQNRINGFLRTNVSPLFDIVLDDAAAIESTPGSGLVKLSPNTKTVTYTGTIAAGATALTMPSGFFSDAVAVGAATPARLRKICIKGAGTAGADFVAYTRYVSDTSITLCEPGSTTLPAKATITAVTNPVIIFCINDYMLDGTGPHRSPFGEQLNQALGFPA